MTKPKFRDEEHALVHQFVIGERLTPVMGLNEEAARGRVIMLLRMRRLLIVDWHPIIDILLGDYQRELKRVESLRETDEPDVQDRDFNQGE